LSDAVGAPRDRPFDQGCHRERQRRSGDATRNGAQPKATEDTPAGKGTFVGRNTPHDPRGKQKAIPTIERQFLCGETHPEDALPHVVGLGHLVERDPTLLALARLAEDWEAEKPLSATPGDSTILRLIAEARSPPGGFDRPFWPRSPLMRGPATSTRTAEQPALQERGGER
jgi:hypothetical protein